MISSISPIRATRTRIRGGRLPVAVFMLFISIAAIPAPLAAGSASEGAGAAEAPSSALGESPVRPNIVFILADDLGFRDVGFHGSDIDTPHIDRLAREGIELAQHYVHPMCTPTRTAFLTGRYPSRFGVYTPQNEQVLPFGTPTLASLLGEAGYDTALDGKWHLGSRTEWGPQRFGFDHSYGSLAGGVTPYTHRYKKGEYTRTWQRDGELVVEGGHVTDLLADDAVSWIESREENPFFLYVAFTAVHIPINEPNEWVDRYRDRIEDESYRLYAACVTHLDAAVGRIIDALERTGHREDTLVVFTSDNGSAVGWRNGLYPYTHPPTPRLGSNLPLRGHKGELYEGGIRVPTVVSWPGHLASGTVIRTPVHVVDWLPTFLRFAHVESTTGLRLDGRDLVELLEGGVDPSARPEAARTFYWTSPSRDAARRDHALRHGDWKLIRHHDGSSELYDLARDPLESRNLARARAAETETLGALLAAEIARDETDRVRR